MHFERCLKTLFLKEGMLTEGSTGTPQGGVISQVMGNLFMHIMHNAFDEWLKRAIRMACLKNMPEIRCSMVRRKRS